jgi:UDP-N-acetylglucosamine acyltransferase
MNQIHPTAIVSSKAKIGDNITVSPFVVIQDDVEIGDNCWIGPSAVIYDGARIGNNVKIHQCASVSNIPQDLSFAGEYSVFIVGDNTVIREYATLHRGTKVTGQSKVGSNCLLMAYSHVAHDCVVGNNCIIVNSVQLGGHVTVEDFAIIGGGTVVHQFSKVGQHSMTGGGYRVIKDVPPYILAAHEPLSFTGLNITGLRRRGFKNEDIQTLKAAYGFLYDKKMNVSQARAAIENEYGSNPLVQNVLSFIEKSKRGLIGS